MTRRTRKCLGLVLLAVLVLYLLAAVVPSAFHKTASGEAAAVEFYDSSSFGGERVLLVPDNTMALVWRLRMIAGAQTEILYSTMDFRLDNSGTLVLSSLLQAAERGVQVKLLVDGLTSGSLLRSKALKALAACDNVTVKAYNPMNLLKPWSLQMRLHDKYLMVDNSVYLFGGRNTNDLFLGEYESRKNIDMELLVVGERRQEGDSLEQLRDYFNAVWNLPETKTRQGEDQPSYEPLRQELLAAYEQALAGYPAVYEQVDLTALTTPVNGITLLTNPYEAVNKEPKLWQALNVLMRAGEQVIIQSPYLICSDEMMADLAALCSTSRVSVITNSVETGANPWGCAEYLSRKGALLETGMTLYETTFGRSNHTKAVLIDDRMSVIGTFNFDMRSCYLDTEMMLAVDSREIAAQLRSEMQTAMDRSTVLYPDGTTAVGEAYESAQLPWYQSVLYRVLRVVILPIRHLL